MSYTTSKSGVALGANTRAVDQNVMNRNRSEHNAGHGGIWMYVAWFLFATTWVSLQPVHGYQQEPLTKSADDPTSRQRSTLSPTHLSEQSLNIDLEKLEDFALEQAKIVRGRVLDSKQISRFGKSVFVPTGVFAADGRQTTKNQTTSSQTTDNKTTQIKSGATEIFINQSGQFQAYRIRRSHARDGEKVDRLIERIAFHSGFNNGTPIQVRAQPQTVRKQTRVISNDLQIDEFGLTTGDGHRQAGGSQIVLEMKQVGDEKGKFSIGEIAPSSWIQSNDGIVHLFTDSIDKTSSSTTRYWIGVRCQESVDDRQVRRLVVRDVVSESAAGKAGIQVSDRIVRWNDRSLSSVDGLVEAIQQNQAKPAKIGILRDGSPLDLSIVPCVRRDPTNVRTIIASATRVNEARRRIDELHKLISLQDNGQNQSVRLLLVGPGVNFGKKDIELQVRRDVNRTKSKLSNLLDRVADKQFGLIVEDDSVMLKQAPHGSAKLSEVNFEPHEIWETMEIGVKGYTFPMGKLVPKVVQGRPVRLELKAELEKHIQADHQGLYRLKTGQIVLPNPLIQFDVEINNELRALKGENNRIRQENQQLRQEINKLKVRLKEQK